MTNEILEGTLVAIMGEISERVYCAGWMDGLEHILWSILVDENPGVVGLGRVTHAEIEVMRCISSQLQGWIHWADITDDGPTFIPMLEWLQEYRQP